VLSRAVTRRYFSVKAETLLVRVNKSDEVAVMLSAAAAAEWLWLVKQ